MSRWKGLRPFAVFLLWTVTSFLCHKLAKMAMSVYVQDQKTYHILLFPLVVTLSQMTCCWGMVRMSWARPFHPLLFLSHLLATLATNSSMALTFASSTMAIKMLEPVSSAMLQTMMLKTPMSWRSVLSLVLVVGGAVMYVGVPWKEEAVALAVILAFLSNVVLGIRNVTMKLSQQDHQQDYELRKWTSSLKFFSGVTLCLLVAYSLETAAKVLPPNSTFVLFLALTSGVFHVAYSYVSMKMVLSYMSVVSHALANIFKRVLVVLLLYVTGRRIASIWNWAGLSLCGIGLCLYLRYKVVSSAPLSKENSEQKFQMRPPQPTSRSLRVILLLLTTIYIICMMSAGLGVTTRARFLAVPEALRSVPAAGPSEYQLKTKPYACCNASASALNAEAFELLDALGGNGSAFTAAHYLRANRQTSKEAPLVIYNATSDELCSDILKVERNIPKEALSTTNYAQRLYLGLQKWRDGQLLINHNVSFQPSRKPLREVREFLLTKPLTMPFDTDALSPYLTNTRAVIAEAQRLHLSIFRDLLAGKKYVVLFGLASFENKGDPAISVGEVLLLEKLGINIVCYINRISCSDERAHESLEIARRYPSDQVAVVMNGGGNIIGYIFEDNCRKMAMKYFSSYQLIVFSESVYMRASESYFDSAIKMYCCNSNLTILLRDRQSMLIARRIFNNGTRLILAPDMAFHNGPVTRHVSPYYDVMWLNRNDGEKPVHDTLSNFPAHVKVGKGDWYSMPSLKGTTSLRNAVNVLLNGYAILQRGRVVITERLHGHILCVLLDIPHVLLDNSDLKLSSFHNTWTRGISNCRLTSSASEAVHLAMELLETYNGSLPCLLSSAHIQA